MEAGPDAGICNFFGKDRHVGPTVGYARRRWAGRGDFRDVLRSEHCLDDTGDGAAQDAMRTRILRVHRRIVDWLPSCLTIGIRVGINIPVANCRDWPPEVVMVLGVEHGDVGVVEANRYKRHEPSAVADTQLLRGGELAYEGEISLRTDHEPEPGSFGLLARSLRTDLPTVVLELIEVSRPF